MAFARMIPRRNAVFAWLAAAGLACNSQPSAKVEDARPAEAPPSEDAHSRAPKPDPARLSFDESTQVLQLYELPEDGAHWLVISPSEPRGVPAQGDFKFSNRADPKAVSVFYTRARGGMSHPVSLQEIVDAKKAAVH